MSEEDAILEEAMDNLGESIQRLRAIQNRLHSTGLDKHLEYRDLLHRVGSALAMSEAAFMEARRKAEREGNRKGRHASRRQPPLIRPTTEKGTGTYLPTSKYYAYRVYTP